MSLDPVDPSIMERRVGRLIERLGFLGDADFVDDPNSLPASQASHSIRDAFDRMGVVGAFCPSSSLGAGAKRPVPVLYVAVAAEGGGDAIHRSVWSQSVVPFLILAKPDGFEVRSGFDPGSRGTTLPWGSLERRRLPGTLASLGAAALRGAAAWRDCRVPTRVDERLGRAVRELGAHVATRNGNLAARPDVINAVIGRFLYLYVLVDRGVIDQDWVRGLRTRGRPACPSVVLREGFGPGDAPPRPWAAEDVWRLFDAIDAALNGSPFPLGRRERGLLDDGTLDLVRRALRSDALVAGERQYGFLDVDYATVRTETISALYECFFEIEQGDRKRKDGAFYTPPFLVDYVVDEVDSSHPIGPGSLVVDPACGSGAFLVAGFRRVAERMRAAGVPTDAPALNEALATTVAGFDTNRQAVNVTRFSLYLTMLDYLPGLKLADIPALMGGRALFPDLSRRVVARDAFAALPRHVGRRATHVLANPPWTGIGKGTPAARRRAAFNAHPRDGALMGSDDGLAEGFYWRAVRDVCAPDGVVAMVLPTKSFIAPSATVFPGALAAHSRVLGMTNLAHFRERLFAHSRAAATVVFATPGRPGPLDWTWRYSPKVSSQPLGDDGVPWAIVVDAGQVERFRQADLLMPGHEWFRDLMLQPLDRWLAHLLTERGPPTSMDPGRGEGREAPAPPTRRTGSTSVVSSLGTFMERAGIRVRRGWSPGETGLDASLLLNAGTNDFRDRLGIREGSPRDYELTDGDLAGLKETHRRAFRGPMLLMPGSQAEAHLVDHPAAYSSSLLGVHFASDDRPHAEATSTLRGIGAYVRTRVGRYLLALFGRTWVFDQRRFEAADLLRLPFPYRDPADLADNSIRDFTQDEFVAFCASRFGVGPLFAEAVTEHHGLREKYQDGRRVEAGASPTTATERRRYRSVIVGELREALGERRLRLEFAPPSRPATIRFRLLIGDADGQPILDPPNGGLAEEVSISLHEAGDGAVADCTKPDMRSAWTVERAYADAMLTARRIFAA